MKILTESGFYNMVFAPDLIEFIKEMTTKLPGA